MFWVHQLIHEHNKKRINNFPRSFWLYFPSRVFRLPSNLREIHVSVKKHKSLWNILVFCLFTNPLFFRTTASFITMHLFYIYVPSLRLFAPFLSSLSLTLSLSVFFVFTTILSFLFIIIFSIFLLYYITLSCISSLFLYLFHSSYLYSSFSSLLFLFTSLPLLSFSHFTSFIITCSCLPIISSTSAPLSYRSQSSSSSPSNYFPFFLP